MKILSNNIIRSPLGIAILAGIIILFIGPFVPNPKQEATALSNRLYSWHASKESSPAIYQSVAVTSTSQTEISEIGNELVKTLHIGPSRNLFDLRQYNADFYDAPNTGSYLKKQKRARQMAERLSKSKDGAIVFYAHAEGLSESRLYVASSLADDETRSINGIPNLSSDEVIALAQAARIHIDSMPARAIGVENYKSFYDHLGALVAEESSLPQSVVTLPIRVEYYVSVGMLSLKTAQDTRSMDAADEAIQAFDKALGLGTQSADEIWIASIFSSKASALVAKERITPSFAGALEANSLYKDAYELLTSSDEYLAPDLVLALQNNLASSSHMVGDYFRQAGEVEIAEKYLEEALSVYARIENEIRETNDLDRFNSYRLNRGNARKSMALLKNDWNLINDAEEDHIAVSRYRNPRLHGSYSHNADETLLKTQNAKLQISQALTSNRAGRILSSPL